MRKQFLAAATATVLGAALLLNCGRAPSEPASEPASEPTGTPAPLFVAVFHHSPTTDGLVAYPIVPNGDGCYDGLVLYNQTARAMTVQLTLVFYTENTPVAVRRHRWVRVEPLRYHEVRFDRVDRVPHPTVVDLFVEP